MNIIMQYSFIFIYTCIIHLYSANIILCSNNLLILTIQTIRTIYNIITQISAYEQAYLINVAILNKIFH